MTDMKVVRWKKYGHDRLYVTDDADRPVGWLDLVSGDLHPVEPELEGALRDAIAEFQAAVSQAAASQTARPQPADFNPSPPSAPAWTDLAFNVPGQAARTRHREVKGSPKGIHRLIYFIRVLADTKTDERAWRVGAGTEEWVGVRLNRLHRKGWHVLHSVPVGTKGADIDHLLIGPRGVYSVNTKWHMGKNVTVTKSGIWINGQGTHHVRNSLHEGKRASRLLSRAVGFPVAVQPCLVILVGKYNRPVRVRSRPDGVNVLLRNDVPYWFSHGPRSLTDDQVDAIFEVARRSTTWTK